MFQNLYRNIGQGWKWVAVTNLLCYGINYGRKKFYVAGTVFADQKLGRRIGEKGTSLLSYLKRKALKQIMVISLFGPLIVFFFHLQLLRSTYCF